MEKNRDEILNEMKALLAALKEQVAVIEGKLSDLEALEELAVEDAALEAVADMIDAEEEAPAEEMQEKVQEEPEESVFDMPEEDEAAEEETEEFDLPMEEEEAPAAEEPVEEEPVEEEPVPEETVENTEPETLIEDMPDMDDSAAVPEETVDEPIDISVDIDLDVPSFETESPVAEEVKASPAEAEEFPAPKASINDVETGKIKKAVLDVAAKKQSWRTDMPGTPVKNIISAISLADRAFLVNTLFKGEPEVFQETISKLNEMKSFDEALAYIEENYPNWNLNSDIVYRLMMAIRRKLK